MLLLHQRSIFNTNEESGKKREFMDLQRVGLDTRGIVLRGDDELNEYFNDYLSL